MINYLKKEMVFEIYRVSVLQKIIESYYISVFLVLILQGSCYVVLFRNISIVKNVKMHCLM